MLSSPSVAAGRAPQLRATRQSDICEKCEEELAGGDEPPQEHKELFRAARALLDNGIENEDEIIPTLVLAANVGQIPHLEHIRDELIVPEVMVESLEEEPHVLQRRIRSLLDPVWNAGGLPRSLHYDESGNWQSRMGA